MSRTSENSVAQAVSQAAAPADTKGVTGICCYIGPNICGVIQKSTIYPFPKKEALKDPIVAMALEKYPGIKDLIVPGEELATDLVKVKTPGEPLRKAYEQLARSL